MSQNLRLSKNRRRGFELLEGRCLLTVSPADPQTAAISDPWGYWQAADSTTFSTFVQREQHLPDSLAYAGTLGEFDVLIRVQATDAAGNPLTEINAGGEFFLRVYVQDTGPVGDGVFSSYLDVTFDSTLARIAGPIDFAYPNGKHSVLVPGEIGRAGAFDDLVRGDRRVQILFSVPMQARSDGELTFAVQPPVGDQGWDTLLYGLDNPVSPTRIQYQYSSLTVLPSQVSGEAGLPDYVELEQHEHRKVVTTPERPAVPPAIPAKTEDNGQFEQIVNDPTPVIFHSIKSVPPLYDPHGLEYLFADYPKRLLEIRIGDEMGRLVAIKPTALNMIFDAEDWTLMSSIKFSVTSDVADTRAFGFSGSSPLRLNLPDTVDPFGIELARSTDRSSSEQPVRGSLDHSSFTERDLNQEVVAPQQDDRQNHLQVRLDYAIEAVGRPISKVAKKGADTSAVMEHVVAKV